MVTEPEQPEQPEQPEPERAELEIKVGTALQLGFAAVRIKSITARGGITSWSTTSPSVGRIVLELVADEKDIA